MYCIGDIPVGEAFDRDIAVWSAFSSNSVVMIEWQYFYRAKLFFGSGRHYC